MAKLPVTLSGIITTFSGSGRDKAGKLQARMIDAKQRQALHKLGFDNTVPFDTPPPFEPKIVAVSSCQVCLQNFGSATHPVSVCYRCGNCVYCGAYNNDRYGNYCFTCGNGDALRFD